MNLPTSRETAGSLNGSTNSILRIQLLQGPGELALGINMLPWLQDANFARFNRMLNYFLIDRQDHTAAQAASGFQRLVRTILTKSVRWRIDHGQYDFPWEIWLSRFVSHIVKRRSLIDGKELPTEAVNVC